jgi:copper transport protein
MSAVRRALLCALTVVGLLGATAGPALAHASFVGSTPAINSHIKESNGQVTLRFSEPVQILNRGDVSIVDGRGVQVDNGTPRADGDRVFITLKGPLVPSSYTVRYRVISADSHAEASAYVFGVGNAKLGEPILAGSGGLKDTSPTAIAARVAELVALGLLLGLIGFRMLVWGPAVERAQDLDGDERDAALAHGQRLFWRSFWGLAVLAGVAETLVLAAKSAVVFHTGILSAAVHPTGTFRLVAASRFGDYLGWRSAALCALVVVGFLTWTAEAGGLPTAGRRGAHALMGILGVSALTMLASQGHASQAPFAPLQITADAAHLAGAAIWIGGLPCLAAVLLRAPRALPEGGRSLASASLARFSKIALWSVVVIAVTGLLRMLGELDSPLQLVTTGYGRDLMLKASLLAPILILAQRNRRLVAALAGGLTPTTAKLRSVARSVQMELAIAMGIVIVAALLVAQIPGRG